jgi:hypothetical protein
MNEGQPVCRRHPEATVVAVCRKCSEGMCDECWQHVLADAPICTACATSLHGRRPRIVSTTVAAIFSAAALAFFASRHASADFAVGIVLGVVVGAAIMIAIAIARLRSVPADGPAVRRRDEEDVVVQEPLAPGDHPYRAKLARIVSRALPRVSARLTATVIVLSFVATASLVPFAVRLPPWERTEVVLAAWWLLGTVTLSWLLFRGARLADDYAYQAPAWAGGRGGSDPSRASGRGAGRSTGPSSSRWLSNVGSIGDVGEGCTGAIIGVLLAAAALAAAWLLVELVAPLFFFLCYWIVVRAIGRVTRNNRGCAGNVWRSLAWGAAWSSLYILPLAAAVVAAHRWHGVHEGAPAAATAASTSPAGE